MKRSNEMMKLQPTPRPKVRGSAINVIGSPLPIKQNTLGGSLIIMPFSFTMLIYFLGGGTTFFYAACCDHVFISKELVVAVVVSFKKKK